MIGKIYVGMATAMFVSGCVIFGKETPTVLPKIIVYSLIWPLAVTINLAHYYDS